MPELVALDLPSGPAFVDALRRIWDDGDAAFPVDQRLPGPARERLFRSLAPSAIVDPTGRSARADGVPVLAGDALVIPTSGTTGEPKGVVLTHDAIDASAAATNARLDIDPTRDRWFATLPLAHIGGLSVVTRALRSETPVTVVHAFDVDATNAAVRSGHTRTSLVLTALGRVDATGWRSILVGGSAIPAALPDNCVRTYGMTETGSGVVYDGYALQGVGVTLADDGEILIDGPMLLRAYRSGTNDQSPTPEGVDPKDDIGRLPTGDFGRFDANGALQVFGRRNDVIVTGGEKVWPDAVERALVGLTGVVEFAVAGQRDDQWGHRTTLFVVPIDTDNPPRLGDVRERVRSQLPAYSAPRAIVVMDRLPRTRSGKVDRRTLSESPVFPTESLA